MSTDSPLAQRQQLRSRLGDHEVADSVLDDALEDISALARGEAGTVGDAWDPEVPPGQPGFVRPTVKIAVLDAARRRVLNPDAYVTEQSGDYMYRRAEGTDGAAYFTPAELKLLRGFRPSSLGGLGVLQVVRPDMYPSIPPMVPTNMDGDRDLYWSYE